MVGLKVLFTLQFLIIFMHFSSQTWSLVSLEEVHKVWKTSALSLFSNFPQVPTQLSSRILASKGLPCCIITATYFYRRKGGKRNSKIAGKQNFCAKGF